MKTRADALREFDDVDMDALDRALVAARAQGGGRSQQLDEMLRDRDWSAVAEFAAYSAQIHILALKPWENPPCVGNEGGDKPEDLLLRRMLDAGLSQYEPDGQAILKCQKRRRVK